MKGTNKNYQKEDNKNNESLAACKKNYSTTINAAVSKVLGA